MNSNSFYAGLFVGILSFFVVVIVSICVSQQSENLRRQAIERGYATYIEGEFTWIP